MVFKKIILTLGWIIMSSLEIANATTINQNIQDILDLPITTLSGETITLGQYQGKSAIYLKFWASWCQPCRKQMPHLQLTYEKYGKDIKVIAVNLGVNDNLKFVNATKEEFGLTMPIAIDTTGKLAQTVNLIGTPYNVLINKDSVVVYKSFSDNSEASKELDKQIYLLAMNKSTVLSKTEIIPVATTSLKINNNSKKISAIFFIATWCHSYLKTSRPTMSKNCIKAQYTINALYQQFPQYNWMGIATRLWTGENELKDYKKKFNITFPFKIDHSNKVFFDHKVKKFPTLILINGDHELVRIDNFENKNKLEKNLKKYISNL